MWELLCINQEGGSRNLVWVWRKYFWLVGWFICFWMILHLLLLFAITLSIWRTSQRVDPAQVFCCMFVTSLFTLDSCSAKCIKFLRTLESKSWLSQEILEIWGVNFYFYLCPVSLIWTVSSSVSIISQWKTRIGLSCRDFVFLTKEQSCPQQSKLYYGKTKQVFTSMQKKKQVWERMQIVNIEFL